MKIFFSITALILASLTIVPAVSSVEVSDKADTQAQKIFAMKAALQYQKEFDSNIAKYNSSKHKVSNVLSEDYGLAPELKKQIARYKNRALPKIVTTKDGAYIALDRFNRLSFSAETLYQGYILFNETKVNLVSFDYDMAKKIVSSDKKVSIFENIMEKVITSSYANNDEFETLIFSTVIVMRVDFDTSWCIFDSCRQARSRRNLDNIMSDIAKLARDCNNGVGVSFITEMSRMGDIARVQNLEHKLETEFNEYPKDELTCQRFVENLHQEEVKARTSRVERRGYGGVLSMQAEENKQENKRDFEAYVKSVCKPYVELRNCLVDNHKDAQAIHDESRGAGKRGDWQDYKDDYEPKPRQGASER